MIEDRGCKVIGKLMDKNTWKLLLDASNLESNSGNANAEAVVDEIEYCNLVLGLEYTAVGIIINKGSGSQ